VLNLERDPLLDLQIVCGVPADKLGVTPSENSSPRIVAELREFLHLLHGHHGFDLPSPDLFLGLNSWQSISTLVDAQPGSAVEFPSLGALTETVSDLESLTMILQQVDSPEFAIWCGTAKSPAREKLLAIIHRLDHSLQRLRSPACAVHCVIPADSLSVRNLVSQIQQSVIAGVRVQTVQLLWGSRIKPQRLEKWAEKIVTAGAGLAWLCASGKPRTLARLQELEYSSGVVLKPGALVQVTDTEYLYVVELPGAKKMELDVGILNNQAVIQFGNVRRHVTLPAACSRMIANNATLSATHISIYFTVQEDLWPTP